MKSLLFRTRGFFAKGNIDQSKGNNNGHKGDNGQKINYSKIHYAFLLNKYALTNKTIPLDISSVNITNLYEGSIPGNTGETIATPNQKTEKLIKKSAATEIKTESNPFIIYKFNIL